MKGQKQSEKRLTVIFLMIIFLFTGISMVSAKKTFSESENRYLQKKPVFTMEHLLNGTYATEYELYLSDQFPGRNQWISVKVFAERAQGKNDVNGVYIGKDQYLIEKFDREDLTGERLSKNLTAIGTFIETMKAQVGNTHVKVMAVPSTAQIMKHKLPEYASPYDQSEIQTEVQNLYGKETVVPVQEMLDLHREEPLYYKTDHHWTTLGAYYGYCIWADTVGQSPWKPEIFHIQTVSRNFYGTVYSKLNVPHKGDHIEIYQPIKDTVYQVYYDGSQQPVEELYNWKALNGKDKYSVFLDGNHGLAVIENKTDDPDIKGRKLLIVRDSFAHSFAPFAVNHFETTYLVDLRYFNISTKNFAAEHGVTDVLLLYQIPSLATEKIAEKINR